MKKILLADSAKLVIELEKAILSNRDNIRLFTASSGIEAINIHKNEKVNLILCALYMPGMNGDEVCRLIRKDDNIKNVSIVMVTTSAKDVDMCLAAGANDVVLKPINPVDLLEKVGKYINIAVRRDTRLVARIGIQGIKGRVSEPFLDNTVDISISGVLIETNHLLNIKEKVSCSFFIPGNPAPVTATGEVVRRTDGKQVGMNYYGVRFLNIGKEDRQTLSNYINSMQKQQTV